MDFDERKNENYSLEKQVQSYRDFVSIYVTSP